MDNLRSLPLFSTDVEPRFRLYQSVYECEQECLASVPTRTQVQYGLLQLQASDRYAPGRDPYSTLMKHVRECMEKMPKFILDDAWLLKQVENITVLNTFARKCECFNDYYMLTLMAHRMFTGQVLLLKLSKMIDKLFEEEVQALDVGDGLRTLRNLFDGAASVQECPLARKIVSLYSYMLTQGYLRQFGFELNDEDYSKMEQKALLSAFSSKKGFYVCLIDTVLFICERIHEFSVTGDLSSFIHSGASYAKWLSEADRILNLAPFTGNLKAHGTSYFSYLADLRELCEQGTAISKYLSNASGVEATLVRRKLASLQLLSNTEITRRAAGRERPAPMGVLVYGHSSVAKSSFTKMLFSYYGSLFDLETGDDFRYVRNPMDEYWSNFDTSKWCIQLDDIAFKLPSKSADVDPTLQDLLNVVNNVPYVPPQAALEDKGKTPVMAELVLATSNSETLNAQEYFWCPLAVRRRLPYVINVVPKDEFLHENGVFIDPLKIPESDAFPDLWTITVRKLVPVMEGGRERASLVDVAVFSNTREFLAHFGRACRAHKANQERSMAADKKMGAVEVCKKCCAPLPHDACVEVQNLDVRVYILQTIIATILNWILTTMMMYGVFDAMARQRGLVGIAFRLIRYVDNPASVMAFYGRYADSSRRATALIRRTLGVMSLLLGSYYAYTQFTTQKEENPVSPAVPTATDEAEPETKVFADGAVQGNMFGTTEEQLQKEESQNVWYNPTIELTKFDVPQASASMANASPEQIRDLFARNCVYLEIRVPGEAMTRHMRAVFLRGHQCVTNAHAFKEGAEKYTVRLIQSSPVAGMTSNITFDVHRRDISFDSQSDICMFDVDCVPPFKDISKFWCDTEVSPSSAIGVLREQSGSVTYHSVFALERKNGLWVEDLGNAYDVHMGVSSRETEMGMCGAVYVALTPRGPIVIGLHMLGNGNRVGIVAVTKSELERLASAPCLEQRPIVQCGFAPNMSCAKRTMILGPLHHKSMFRYFEKGTGRLFGTFVGFRPRPKSAVCATPLQDVMLKHYGVEVAHGPPVMKGWLPWRKNVIEMVQPTVTYDRLTLRKAREGYLNDVLSELPEGWQQELVVLSDKAAVNGLPGVKYIDRMNLNTSMGFPWNTTKMEFVRSAATEEEPEAVDFGPEVWARVRAIEDSYKQGILVHPVFTGHLKDEAVPLAKIKAAKTRLFTGAPGDWSILVRKYLLSFVRLVQKNKFVFEAGPGVVCQSVEWGKIREWLVAHGLDQLIAGDYGKFDKRMLADFILAAFVDIVEIHRAAGFDEIHCRILMCIGEDLAFSVCNIDGDLVQFFGTNPSGHPLTVIINSIVNSLYMRYAYYALNPAKEVTTFRKNVRLFTYGDDNTSGVSKSIPWYNHTSIQAEFAKIGVEYTMADKEAASVPYIHIDEVSFLKRKWVWDEEVGAWLAPLEEASMIKSLTMWVPSKSVDKYKQMVDTISSACREYFFYGRAKYEEKREFFSGVLQAEPFCFYVKETTLPTFDSLVEKFHRASEAL